MDKWILSKRSDLPSGISIKPDMTLGEQRIEGSLLKERWLLIQQGIDKKDKVKIALSLCSRKEIH